MPPRGVVPPDGSGTKINSSSNCGIERAIVPMKMCSEAVAERVHGGAGQERRDGALYRHLQEPMHDEERREGDAIDDCYDGAEPTFVQLLVETNPQGEVHRRPQYVDNAGLEVGIRLDTAWPGHNAGQFAFVTFDDSESAHPFTISSAWHKDGRLTFTIKGIGDYTRALPELLSVEKAVIIEGPMRASTSRVIAVDRSGWRVASASRRSLRACGRLPMRTG